MWIGDITADTPVALIRSVSAQTLVRLFYNQNQSIHNHKITWGSVTFLTYTHTHTLMQNSAQQLNKSFICNVPLPHLSSFRCKRSNNFLNKRKQKNIYKIPIQLIINRLSKAPLCIWTTAVFCWKRTHCSYISNLSFLKNKTEKKSFIVIIIIIIYLQNAPEISFHLK